MWLVVFVDPTQSGKSIKSEWDQAAMELSGKVNMGKVFSKKLARLCGVKSFPTIMYFPASDPNSSENYEGEITANDIVTWALKKHNGEPIGKLVQMITKASFFVHCTKMQLITLQNFSMPTYFSQFLWFFNLEC